jgi:hypothetical protein
MKIHANARTRSNSRKLLVKRVEEEGWSLMVAQIAIQKYRAGTASPDSLMLNSRFRQSGAPRCARCVAASAPLDEVRKEATSPTNVSARTCHQGVTN